MPVFNREFRRNLGTFVWIMPASALLAVLACIILSHLAGSGIAYFIAIMGAVCVFPAIGIVLFPNRAGPEAPPGPGG